jgi:uncharacterized SAM-binding protein YcdF (DUF218 family)
MLWAVSTTWVGRAVLRLREECWPRTRIEDCPAADALLVPSGDGPARLQALPPGQSRRRSELALALYFAGKARHLVFTDGGPEGALSRTAGMLEGIPAANIIVVAPARNTLDEAALFVRTAKEHQWHRVILVTSGYHMARAKVLVEHAAATQGIHLKVFGYAGDSGKFFYKGNTGFRDYLPSVAGWERSSRAAREVVGEWACRAGIC